jgi:uncharacterized zinc-type alcohol dehydrogenase-like protein
MRNNDWAWTQYPFVGGHEVVGVITAMGGNAEGKGLEIGDAVGLGWNAGCCMHCDNVYRLSDQLPELEQTIVMRHGGFADRVRCNWEWAVKIPMASILPKLGRFSVESYGL